MRRISLTQPHGVRFVPRNHSGTGVLTLAGSSGRVDDDRARLLGEAGAVAESIRWFGGPGQSPGPWEVPLETFLIRVGSLARECDRVVVCGTSFGAEAALLVGAHSSAVAAVVAFAPSDVVWAGVTPDGRVTSHWTLDGAPLPHLGLVQDWSPSEDPPSFTELYRLSHAADPDAAAAATIAAERVPEVVLVVGGADRVWPSAEQASRIRARRARHGLATTVVVDDEAGHRTVLPGEAVVGSGARMARGGTEEADRRLGEAAWPHVAGLLSRR